MTPNVQHANLTPMKVENLIPKHFASASALADALGITRSAVSQWREKGVVPVVRQYQIEVVTKGKVKVGS